MSPGRPECEDERVNFALAARRPRFLVRSLVRAVDLASPATVLALLLLWSLVMRCALFGNPLIDHDDEFYLLVGERMLHGVLPYVDIWDRKPVGLFLLYAGIRTLGGDGIVQYQLVACAFAAVTAFVIWLIARRVAEPASAFMAAVIYLTYSVLFNGGGGEAPVFYNLLVALAAFVLVGLRRKAVAVPIATETLAAVGCAAMLLVGVAIQIKYTVIFEGLFFGVVLMGYARVGRLSRPRFIALTALWIACALLPTMLATLAYAAMGHLDAFVQANFISIFYRHERELPANLRLAATIVLLLPLLYCAYQGWNRRVADRAGAEVKAFIVAWCAASILGYLAFGTYYDHYALPMLVPLSILASLGFAASRTRIGARGTFAFALAAACAAIVARVYVTGDARQLAPLSQLVRANLNGCLFVYEGEPILYKTTNACTLSKFVFPSHLNAAKERGALGVDPQAETRRILALRPSVIVTSDHAHPADTNFGTRALVEQALMHDYRLAGAATVGTSRWLVYALRR